MEGMDIPLGSDDFSSPERERPHHQIDVGDLHPSLLAPYSAHGGDDEDLDDDDDFELLQLDPEDVSTTAQSMLHASTLIQLQAAPSIPSASSQSPGRDGSLQQQHYSPDSPDSASQVGSTSSSSSSNTQNLAEYGRMQALYEDHINNDNNASSASPTTASSPACGGGSSRNNNNNRRRRRATGGKHIQWVPSSTQVPSNDLDFGVACNIRQVSGTYWARPGVPWDDYNEQRKQMIAQRRYLGPSPSQMQALAAHQQQPQQSGGNQAVAGGGGPNWLQHMQQTSSNVLSSKNQQSPFSSVVGGPNGDGSNDMRSTVLVSGQLPAVYPTIGLSKGFHPHSWGATSNNENKKNVTNGDEETVDRNSDGAASAVPDFFYSTTKTKNGGLSVLFSKTSSNQKNGDDDSASASSSSVAAPRHFTVQVPSQQSDKTNASSDDGGHGVKILDAGGQVVAVPQGFVPLKIATSRARNLNHF